MAALERDTVFGALARPQMFAGVSYSFFVLNLALTTEVFLITRSFWAILTALAAHAIGYALCAREPRFLDLWLLNIGTCPRVPNRAFWGGNSYSP